MPVYEYEVVDPERGCDGCRCRFEVRQSMTDKPLRACPRCGERVHRVVSLCSVSTSPSVKSMLSDKNLKQKGFTKLVNEGGGKLRRI